MLISILLYTIQIFILHYPILISILLFPILISILLYTVRISVLLYPILISILLYTELISILLYPILIYAQCILYLVMFFIITLLYSLCPGYTVYSLQHIVITSFFHSRNKFGPGINCTILHSYNY